MAKPEDRTQSSLSPSGRPRRALPATAQSNPDESRTQPGSWNKSTGGSGMLRRLALPALISLVSGILVVPSASAVFPFPSKPAWVSDPYRYEDYLFSAVNPTEFSPSNFRQSGAQSSNPALQASPQELHGVIGPSVDRAWRITTGRPDVTTAVLDDGIQWRNQSVMRDLAAKVRLNSGELPVPRPSIPPPDPSHPYDKNGDGVFNLRDYCSNLGPSPITCEDSRVSDANGSGMIDPEDLILLMSDGVDSDGNGYVDDIAGWDAFQNDNNPLDDVSFGHGSGRAIEAVAEANNGGDVGNCPNCMFLPVRVGDSFIVSSSNFAKGVAYAVDAGANLIQAALGALSTSSFGQKAIDYAYSNGVPVIAAMGDEEYFHHNMPQGYERTIGVNAVRNPTTADFPESYLHMSNCTNYGGQVWVTVPTTACSSGATGNAAGIAGLAISVAKNRIAQGRLTNYVKDDGTLAPYPLSPNEIAQILRASADDIDFSTPRGADPANNYSLPPAMGAIASQRWHTVAGWDMYSGYGRINAWRAVELISDSTTAAPKIPPEAEIDSPSWFEILPTSGSVAIEGRAAANRADNFDWVLEWAPGPQPPEWPAADSWFPIASGSSSQAVSGVLGNLDMASVATMMGQVTGPPTTPSGLPDPHKFSIRVRLVVTDNFGNRGEYQKHFFVHDDPDLLPGFPYRLGAGGESSPAFADLNGDGADELILADSDGKLHAFRPDLTELPGWPTSSDPIPLASGARAYATGALPSVVHAEFAAGPPAIGDLEGDGIPEVVAADSEGKVYVFEPDGTRKPGFPVQTNRTFSSNAVRNADNRVHWSITANPILADLNKDGDLEIIAGANDRHVYVWQPDGSPLNGWPVLIRDPAKVASVDPTNHKITFKAGANQRIGSKIIVPPSVGDLDGDGSLEVLVGVNEEYAESPNLPGFSPLPGIESGNGRAYAIKATGLASPGVPPGAALHPNAFMPGWPVKVPLLALGMLPSVATGINGPPVAADLDGDGKDEVVVQGFAGATMVFKGNGVGFFGRDSSNRDYPLVAGPPGAASRTDDTSSLAAVGGVALARLTTETTPNVIGAGSGLGQFLDLGLVGDQTPSWFHLNAWSVNSTGSPGGAFLDGFPHPISEYPFLTQPMAADIDGDGSNEAVVATAGYEYQAVDASGKIPDGWPKFTGGWNAATLAVGDWRGDGTQVAVAPSRRGRLFAWQTSGSVCTAQWPKLNHDQQNTGNLGLDGTRPGEIVDLTATSIVGGARISWTAPGDDGSCGTIAGYEIRVSDSPLDWSNWSSGTVLTASVPPGAPGSLQQLDLGPELGGKYLGLRAFDEAGHFTRIRSVRIPSPSSLVTISGRFSGGQFGAIAVFTGDTGQLVAYRCCIDPDGSWAVQVPPASCPSGYKVLFIPGHDTQRYTWYAGKQNWSAADCVPAPSSGNDMDASTPGVLAGTVREASSGADVNGAVVYAYSSTGVFAGWTKSGYAGSGRYRLQLDPSQSYKLYVVAPTSSLEDKWFESASGFAEASAVAPPATNLDLSLREGAIIAGTITAGGVPVSGAYVSAYDACGCRSPRNVLSGATGAYSVKVVSTSASGATYKVRAIYLGTTKWYGGPSFPSATAVPAPTSGVDLNF
jgi:hypothetical protein